MLKSQRKRGSGARRVGKGAGFLTACLVLASCTDLSTPAEPTANDIAPDPSKSAALLLSRTPRNIHEHFLDLASQIPGFGGMYYDIDGVMVVQLTDVGRSEYARQVIGAFAATGVSVTLPQGVQTRVTRARFSYEQLAKWYGDLLATEPLDVTITDIDERRNRIVIGVSDLGKRTMIDTTARRHGIPMEAVVVQEFAPADVGVTLTQKRRPLIGGLKISRSNGGWCTQGYNVRLQLMSGGFDSRDYFLTNSHCTATFGQIDNSDFGQPTMSNPVGSEYADPPLRASSGDPFDLCPAGRSCRASDAALIRVDSDVSVKRGRIAQTSGQNLTITGERAIHEIFGFVYVGLPLVKVGARTGTTTGTVVATCVNAPQSDSGVDTGRTMVCQDAANYFNNGGDSGSPVYHTDSQNRHWVLGINWSGTNANAGFYSPWDEINNEMRDHILSEFGDFVSLVATP